MKMFKKKYVSTENKIKYTIYFILTLAGLIALYMLIMFGYLIYIIFTL